MKQKGKKRKNHAKTADFGVVSEKGAGAAAQELRHLGADIFGVLFQTAIVFMGVYAAIYAMADGIGMPYMKKKLDTIILVTVFGYALVFCLKKYILFAIPIILLIYGRLFYVYKQVLLQGFYHFENVIIDSMNEYFGMNLLHFVAGEEKAYALTFILAALVQILALFCAFAVYVGSLRQVLYLLFVLFAGMPFLFGRSASGLMLILLTVVVLFLSSMALVPDQERAFRGRRKNCSFSFYALGIYGILLLLISLFISDESFKKSQPVRAQMRSKLETAVREIDLNPLWEKTSANFRDFFFSDEERLFNIEQDIGSYTGGIGGGKLGRLGKVTFTNETQLKLMIPADTATLYMKGFSGVYYNKTAWGEFSAEDTKRYQNLLDTYGNKKFSGQDLTGQFLELFFSGAILPANDKVVKDMAAIGFNPLKKPMMIVDYVKASREYCYLPYFSEEDGTSKAAAQMDSYYLPGKGGESYTASYYNLNYEQVRALIYYLENGVSQTFMPADEKINEKADKMIEDYYGFEQEYRKFVHDVYTVLPEGTERITTFTIQNFSDPWSSMYVPLNARTVLDKVDQIRSFLAHQTTYSLTPGKLPEEKDFAEYFLFENRQGYCVHYATTAVLMLRSLGIPARYVEGYIVTADDVLKGIKGGSNKSVSYTLNANAPVTQEELTQGMVTVEIRDTNAHAWIEVYLDSFGWVPMEVTAGYSGEGVIESFNSEIREQIDNLPLPTRLPTNTPTPGASSGVASGNVNAEDEEPISPSPSAGGPNGKDSADEAENKTVTWFSKLPLFAQILVCSVCLFPLLLVGCMIRYVVFLKVRKNRLTKGKTNERVLCIYHEMEKILRKIPVYKKSNITYLEFAEKAAKRERVPDDFPAIMALILKARFSDEIIAKEECEMAEASYQLLRKRFYQEVYGNKRKWYKYILLL